MKRSILRGAAAGLAAVTALSMTALPATAAENEGPYVFDAAGSGQAVSVVVGLPQALADGLAPVIQQVPGVDLVGNELQVNLSNVLAELELPLAQQVPGAVTALAEANSVTGSLSGLVDQLLGGTGQCFDSPVEVSVPPDAETPLVSFSLLQAECTEDADGRTAIASSKIADLEVNLAGALAILPAEAAAPITDAVDQVSGTVTEQILTPIVDQVLTPVQDAVNDNLGVGLDLSEAVRVPELIDLPLVSIDLIESTTRNITDGASVRSVSTSTLAGVSLLGTVCIPDTTYRTEAFATGEPGGNDYASSIPPIDLAICDTGSLSPILRLLDVDGVLGDVLVNLGDGQLKPLSELLGGAGLPTEDVLNGLEDVLATIGVSTVVQGQQTNAVRSDDGRRAGVAVDPFRVTVAPLANFVGGTPLEGLKVELRGLTVASNVAAAPAPPATDVAPDPAPEPALPRTGGGAAAGLLGTLALGGAFALRRQR
jgi:hypothetical protein